MKLIAAALVALGTLAATASFAEAKDDGHQYRHWHRHHGPVVVVHPGYHRDWHRPFHRWDHEHRHHRYDEYPN